MAEQSTNVVDRLEKRILDEATPRFTIRELLLVTLLAGALCGWWVEHRRADSLYLEKIVGIGKSAKTESDLKYYKGVVDDKRSLADEYQRQGYHVSRNTGDGTVRIVYEDQAVTKARREQPMIQWPPAAQPNGSGMER